MRGDRFDISCFSIASFDWGVPKTNLWHRLNASALIVRGFGVVRVCLSRWLSRVMTSSALGESGNLISSALPKPIPPRCGSAEGRRAMKEPGNRCLSEPDC